MSKIIASGEIVKTENLVVTASVAVNTTEESGSASGADVYSVYLTAKKYNAEELPVDPITFADIAAMVEEESSSAAGMIVPGVEGEDDVELQAPVAVKYAKTKAFEGDNGACVFATLRYEY